MKTPVWLLMLLLVGLIFFLFFLNLVLGSVSIPFRAVWDICLWGDHENHIWTNIIWKSRMPQAVTALVAGAGLSVSGLQMQTVFRNPLAGPSVLGISSGAGDYQQTGTYGSGFCRFIVRQSRGSGVEQSGADWQNCGGQSIKDHKTYMT